MSNLCLVYMRYIPQNMSIAPGVSKGSLSLWVGALTHFNKDGVQRVRQEAGRTPGHPVLIAPECLTWITSHPLSACCPAEPPWTRCTRIYIIFSLPFRVLKKVGKPENKKSLRTQGLQMEKAHLESMKTTNGNIFVCVAKGRQTERC